MPGGDVFGYARHRPEQSLLYQLIEPYWPEFQLHISEREYFLPRQPVLRVNNEDLSKHQANFKK
ncbi:MAG: hypothetical protein ACI90U_003134 [Pseudomonadales bacterium]|jgi:hypothetical protein